MRLLTYRKADAEVPIARIGLEPPSFTLWGGRVRDPSEDPFEPVVQYDRWTWRFIVVTRRKVRGVGADSRDRQRATTCRELVIKLWRRVAVRPFDPEKDA